MNNKKLLSVIGRFEFTAFDQVVHDIVLVLAQPWCCSNGVEEVFVIFLAISGIDLIGMVHPDLECPGNTSDHMATSTLLSLRSSPTPSRCYRKPLIRDHTPQPEPQTSRVLASLGQ